MLQQREGISKKTLKLLIPVNFSRIRTKSSHLQIHWTKLAENNDIDILLEWIRFFASYFITSIVIMVTGSSNRNCFSPRTLESATKEINPVSTVTSIKLLSVWCSLNAPKLENQKANCNQLQLLGPKLYQNTLYCRGTGQFHMSSNNEKWRPAAQADSRVGLYQSNISMKIPLNLENMESTY